MNKLLNKKLLLTYASFLLLTIYFFLSQYVISGDTYFHLSIGREVIQTGQIPQKDSFVYGSSNTAYISTEWLSGAIFYLLGTSFGISALLVLRVAFGLLTVYFTFKSLRLITNNYIIINVFVLLIGYLLPFRLNGGRPEMFSLVFLAMLNYACLHFFLKKKISPITYLLPPILFLWPNLHGFSIFGIILLAMFCIITYFQNKDATEKSHYMKFAFIGISSIALALVHYQRVFDFIHVGEYTKYIVEFVSLWQRLDPTGLFARHFNGITSDIYIFIILLITYIVLLVKTVKTNKPHQIILSIFYLTFFLLPFKAYRLITPMLVLALPYTVLLARKVFTKFSSNIYWITIYTTIFLVIGYSTIIGHQLGGERLAIIYPVNAAKYIDKNLSSNRLFTIYAWKEYAFWTMPHVKIYSDIVTQYRTIDDFRDEQKLHSPQASKSEIEALVSKYKINVVINTQPEAARIIGASITPVYKLDDWKLVFIDNISAVYAKNETIKNMVVDLSHIHPELDTRLKYSLKNEKEAINQLNNLLQVDPGNEFARTQLIYYYLTRQKNIAKTKTLAEESREVAPLNPFFSYVLALVYLSQQNCPSTILYANEALEKNKYDKNLKKAIIQTLDQCR